MFHDLKWLNFFLTIKKMHQKSEQTPNRKTKGAGDNLAE